MGWHCKPNVVICTLFRKENILTVVFPFSMISCSILCNIFFKNRAKSTQVYLQQKSKQSPKSRLCCSSHMLLLESKTHPVKWKLVVVARIFILLWLFFQPIFFMALSVLSTHKQLENGHLSSTEGHYFQGFCLCLDRNISGLISNILTISSLADNSWKHWKWKPPLLH